MKNDISLLFYFYFLIIGEDKHNSTIIEGIIF